MPQAKTGKMANQVVMVPPVLLVSLVLQELQELLGKMERLVSKDNPEKTEKMVPSLVHPARSPPQRLHRP